MCDASHTSYTPTHLLHTYTPPTHTSYTPLLHTTLTHNSYTPLLHTSLIQGAVVESVEHGSHMREIVGSNSMVESCMPESNQ